MAQITVNPEEMRRVAREIQNQIGEWDTAVREIYRLHEEMDGMWDGDANDAFNERFLEDRTKFNSLTSLMTSYAAIIDTAASNYDYAEMEATGIVRR